MKAIVLLSGGMDSALCASIALERYEGAFLHVSYKHKAWQKELEAFHRLSDHFGVKERLVCSLEHLRRIGGSSLTDDTMEVVRAGVEQEGIPTSYVPFRNAHFLAIAVSWAEVMGAQKIFIGAVEEDSAGYPDCRREFYEAFNRVIEVGTKPDTHIEVVTPLIGLTKKEIVERGLAKKVPFDLTWSCYLPGPLACGECDSCFRRLRGFREAGAEDPLAYQTKPLKLMRKG